MPQFFIQSQKPPSVKKYGRKILLYYLNQYKKLFVSLSGLLMDIYTLARMFYYDNDESIIYAGSNHIKRYNDFFQFFLTNDPILSIDIQYINNNVNRCIEHQDLPQYVPLSFYKQHQI